MGTKIIFQTKEETAHIPLLENRIVPLELLMTKIALNRFLIFSNKQTHMTTKC